LFWFLPFEHCCYNLQCDANHAANSLRLFFERVTDSNTCATPQWRDVKRSLSLAPPLLQNVSECALITDRDENRDGMKRHGMKSKKNVPGYRSCSRANRRTKILRKRGQFLKKDTIFWLCLFYSAFLGGERNRQKITCQKSRVGWKNIEKYNRYSVSTKKHSTLVLYDSVPHVTSVTLVKTSQCNNPCRCSKFQVATPTNLPTNMCCAARAVTTRRAAAEFTSDKCRALRYECM
jgi:hypothetical protein